MTDGNLGGTNKGGNDVFLAKYDTGGTKLWAKQFGTTASETGFAITTRSGYLYISGTTGGTFPGNTPAGSNDFFLAKYTTDGSAVWVQQFGSTLLDTSYGVATDPLGNVFVTGYTMGSIPPNSSHSGSDIFLVKYAK